MNHQTEIDWGVQRIEERNESSYDAARIGAAQRGGDRSLAPIPLTPSSIPSSHQNRESPPSHPYPWEKDPSVKQWKHLKSTVKPFCLSIELAPCQSYIAISLSCSPWKRRKKLGCLLAFPLPPSWNSSSSQAPIQLPTVGYLITQLVI